MHRPTIGIIALVLLATFGGLWLWDPAGKFQPGLASACLRVGAVMGALWLAHPELQRVPAWLYRICIAAAIVVAIRPRLAFILVPVVLAYLVLRPRKRAAGNSAAKTTRRHAATGRTAEIPPAAPLPTGTRPTETPGSEHRAQ